MFNFLRNLFAAEIAKTYEKSLRVGSNVVQLAHSIANDPQWSVENEWCHWSCWGYTLKHDGKKVSLEVRADDEENSMSITGISMNVVEERYLAQKIWAFNDRREQLGVHAGITTAVSPTRDSPARI